MVSVNGPMSPRQSLVADRVRSYQSPPPPRNQHQRYDQLPEQNEMIPSSDEVASSSISIASPNSFTTRRNSNSPAALSPLPTPNAASRRFLAVNPVESQRFSKSVGDLRQGFEDDNRVRTGRRPIRAAAAAGSPDVANTSSCFEDDIGEQLSFPSVKSMARRFEYNSTY